MVLNQRYPVLLPGHGEISVLIPLGSIFSQNKRRVQNLCFIFPFFKFGCQVETHPLPKGGFHQKVRGPHFWSPRPILYVAKSI